MKEPIIDFGFSLNTPDPQQPVRKFWDGVILAVLFGGVGFAGAWLALAHFFQMPSSWLNFLREVLEQRLILSTPNSLALLALIFGISGGVLGFSEGFKPRDALKHIRGRRLLEGDKAIKAANKITNEEAGEGVNLGEISFSAERESTHTIIVGGVGAGKTTIAHHFLKSIFEKNEKAIIVDWKGDFTEGYEGLIFNPLDKRSKRWAIAKDVLSTNDAQVFAKTLIPDQKNGDNYFINAGQQILTGLIVKLQAEKPEEWTWDDLFSEAVSGYDSIRRTIETYYPEALSNIEEKGKQTQGVLSQISAKLEMVRTFARAEKEAATLEKIPGQISAREWVKDNKNYKKNQIILGGISEYEHIGRAFMALFITYVSNQLLSLPDSKSRKIWLLADEFPKLGKVDAILSLIAVGRSKGARVVLLAQDIAQIRDTFGADKTKSLNSMVGTIIVGRTQGGETAETISKNWIGTREVERRNITSQGNGAKSASWQAAEMLVVSPSELVLLGKDGKHINALVLGYGDYVLKLPFNFVNPSKKREGFEMCECFKGEKRRTEVTSEILKAQPQELTAQAAKESNEVNNEVAAHHFADAVSASQALGLFAVIDVMDIKTKQPTAAPAHTVAKEVKEIEEELGE